MSPFVSANFTYVVTPLLGGWGSFIGSLRLGNMSIIKRTLILPIIWEYPCGIL